LAAERPAFRVGLPCRFLRGLALAEARLERAGSQTALLQPVTRAAFVRCAYLLQQKLWPFKSTLSEHGIQIPTTPRNVVITKISQGTSYTRSVNRPDFARTYSNGVSVSGDIRWQPHCQGLHNSWPDVSHTHSCRMVDASTVQPDRQLGRGARDASSRRSCLAQSRDRIIKRLGRFGECEADCGTVCSRQTRCLVPGQSRGVAPWYANPIARGGPARGEADVRQRTSGRGQTAAAKVCACRVANRQSRQETRRELDNPRRITVKRCSRTQQEIRRKEFNPPRNADLGGGFPMVQRVPAGPIRRGLRGRTQ